MTTRWALVVLSLLAACSSQPASHGPLDAPTSPTTAATPTVLVVTHTAGFRHSSIAIAETTIEALGRSSGLFSVSFCPHRRGCAAQPDGCSARVG